MNPTARILLACAFFGAQILADVSMLIWSPESEYQFAIVMGIALAQSGILAGWLVMKPFAWPVRGAAVFAMFAFLAMAISYRIYLEAHIVEPILMIVGSLVVVLIVLTAVFGVLRAQFSWRLAVGKESEATPTMQFKLIHGLAWMAGIAVVIGVGRLLFAALPQVRIGEMHMDPVSILAFLLLVLIPLTLAPSLAWMTFSPQWPRRIPVVAGLFAVLIVAQTWMFYVLIDADSTAILVVIILSKLSWSAGSMMLLRLAGVRFA